MVFEEIIINQTIQIYATPLLTLFFKLITYFGHPLPWFLLGAWLFWLGKEKKSFTIMSLVLMSSFFAGLLKQIFLKPRPEGIGLIIETGYSMPSGHATLAGTIAAYAWLSKKISKNLKYLIVTLALLTGISRIYLGVHFVSDVLAGLLIGLVIGWFIFKLETKITKMEFHISKIQEEALIVFFFVMVIIFDLFVPAEYYGAYALFGYFAGYAIYRHTDLEECLTRAQTRTQEILALGGGTILLGIIGGSAYLLTEGLVSQVLFFITGLFVTLIWPLVISKTVLKREAHKAKKKRK